MRADELTFVILTHNEAARIEQTLRSVVAGAPCLVLDAQSQDDTRLRAEACGATVETRAWKNFVDTRSYALGRVQTPWVFMLDADEQLDVELRAEILALNGEAAGYRCRRRNRLCGAVIQGGAWGNEWVLRLVQTHLAHVEGRQGGELHECLVVNGPTKTLQGGIDHDSYPTLTSYWLKFNRYTSLEAQERQHASRAALGFQIIIVTLRAIWHFFGRGGWRDGWRGLFIALASAAYPLVVSVKTWRRSR